MDAASTLVLEGRTDTLPSLKVSDTASVDGNLILRISLPPTFSSYGKWQNYTIMTCSRQCSGEFQNVKVEKVGPCTPIEEVGEVRESENLMSIAISFGKTPICFAPHALPRFALCGFLWLLSVVG